MDFSKVERRIVDQVDLKLKEFGFRLYKVDLQREHYANFILEREDRHFIFGIRFLHYSSEIGIEPKILVSYNRVTEIVKKVIGWESEYYHGWLAISARIGDLINPKNSDGFFNDNDCLQIDFKPTENEIEKAISKLMKKYFHIGALNFIEKTNTLEKAECLANEWVLKSDERINRLAYFGHIPWQITTGIILAKLVDNPNYDQLLERYNSYAKNLDPEENEWIKDFYAFSEYFRNPNWQSTI
ncbi:MAG: hypothetical protein HOP30_21880 [Cyclobacteriaceae bacterium]|nr:hypothetical protein [Cyclobacteriaceae bacterium]